MQSRVVPLEEGKDPAVSIKASQYKPFPIRLLQLFLLLLALCITFLIISMYTIKRSGVQTAGTSVMPAFKPCFEEPNTLDRWIRRPSNLLHKMSDEELFWMASFAPRIKKYPLKRVPKIAFMFLTKGLLPWRLFGKSFWRGMKGYIRSIFIRCQHLKSNFHLQFSIGDKSQVRFLNGVRWVCVMLNEDSLLMRCLISRTSGSFWYLNLAFLSSTSVSCMDT